jgi:hypothetical protein
MADPAAGEPLETDAPGGAPPTGSGHPEGRSRASRIHIVGCRRSGTTLMMELLWLGFRFSGRDIHESSVFETIPAGETLYLTKKPPDTTRIRHIFQADGQLHVIAMLRDPRAVITSRHTSRPDVYFAGYRRWCEYVAAIERLRGHPRFMIIRYEDLLRDPDATQAAIARRFPFLQAVRPFSSYPLGSDVPEPAAASLNGVRPFDVSRIDGWKAHLPRVKGQLQRHPQMTEDLVRTGYESDTTWTEILHGVEPYTQDYKDEGPGLLRRLETGFRFWLKTRRYLRQLGD